MIQINDIRELHDLLEDAEEIGIEKYKHDMNWVTYIAPYEGKFYRFTVLHSYNNGIMFDESPPDFEEVEKVLVTTYEWMSVK